MARNEILAITFELQRLTVILANQVTQPGLRKPDPHAKLRRQLPFKLLRRGVDRLMWWSRRLAIELSPGRLVGFSIGR